MTVLLKSLLKRMLAIFVLLLNFAYAQETKITCYNDDSLDVVNQDAIPLPWTGGPAPTPLPGDCWNGPAVAIDRDGRVLVDGVIVYGGGVDPAVEARVSPLGPVAILTANGALHLYKEGKLHAWYIRGIRSVEEFKMTRTGALIAKADDGALIINGGVRATIHTVVQLYTGAAGRIVALLSDGSVVDSKGTIRARAIDPVKAIKVTADNTVIWLTQEGRLGSTRNPKIYESSFDPVESFKVNPSGQVAYLTRDGRLGRDGTLLYTNAIKIEKFRIMSSGTVVAVDVDGKAHFYK